MSTTSPQSVTVSLRTVYTIAVSVIVAIALAVSLPLALRGTRTVVHNVQSRVPQSAGQVAQPATGDVARLCAQLKQTGPGSAAGVRLADAVSASGQHC